MKDTVKIWKIEQEMRRYNLDILGICECRWTESEKLKLISGESAIYSGRVDGVYRSGIESYISWNRIIIARFYSKYTKLTIIHTYTPTLYSKYEDKGVFYEKFQSIVKRLNEHNLHN